MGPKGGIGMNLIERIMVEPFEKFYEKLLVFLPNLFTSLILLVFGFLLGFFMKWIFMKIFRAINLDGLSQKMGMKDALGRSGFREPLSLILSRILKWFTIITFIIVAMQNLSIPTVEHLIDRMFLYVPNIFTAALILVLGYILGNFFGRAAIIASVNADMKSAGLIGKSVKFIVILLSCTMALEQLGIGKDTIVIAFAIVFGGIIFAFSLAFGLGGKDIAKGYMDRKLKKESNEDEMDHL
jgi:hypothetical protein